jgi:hypothetical protein
MFFIGGGLFGGGFELSSGASYNSSRIPIYSAPANKRAAKLYTPK